MKKYDKLRGQVITGYSISEDNKEITFNLASHEPVTLRTWGDCCSTTWIESIDNPSALKGKVLNVEDIEMPDKGNVPTPKRECVDQVNYYGLRITTEHGIAVLDYRNDSNGYYGGDIYVKGKGRWDYD